MSRKFTVEMVLERVTTCEREANRLLATYGDGDAQVAQMRKWKEAGATFDDAKAEWFWQIPVPNICIDGKPIKGNFVPAKDETDALANALDELYSVAKDAVDPVKLARMLSDGYQYKTRPVFKEMSKGRITAEVAAAKGKAEAYAEAKAALAAGGEAALRKLLGL